MFILTLAILLSASGETQPPAENDLKTYIITFKDGSVCYGSYVENGEQVTIQPDTPWEPQPPIPTLRSKIADYRLELRHKREERREEEARKAGYVKISTATSERYAKAAEYDRAVRSRDMARRVEEKLSQTPVALETLSNADPASEAPEPSPVRRYGLQAAILVAGLAASAMILRFFIFQREA